MKCPNSWCCGGVDTHVNSDGSGTRYCLDGCAYYEEFPAGTERPPRKHHEPKPKAKMKVRGKLAQS